MPPSHTEPVSASWIVADRSELLARENAPETLSRGRLYAVLGVGGAVVLIAATWLRAGPSGHDWFTFAALAAAATVAQAFPVYSSRNMLYHTTVVFLVAAALLLPPQLLLLIPVAQLLPDWARERRPWTLQGFDAANYTLSALAAWGAAHLVETRGAVLVPHTEPRFALAGLSACIAFVASSHVLVAAVLRPDRSRRFHDTSLFSLEGLSVDFVLAVLGISLAAFWEMNPWLVFAAFAPLVVVHRSLSVPQLRAQARIDPKTGLYNARWFSTALAAELARATRFERPMAVIMADLDLLRDVNNTHGHLAGDAILRGIAEIFRRELRDYDVPARFGGEEFSILLPETTAEQAVEIAERIRRAVAGRSFHVPTAAEPLHATLSLGIAAFPQDGLDANQLIHQADLAVYRAKLQGRNRVLAASSEPLLVGAAERAADRRAQAALRAANSAALPAPPEQETGEMQASAIDVVARVVSALPPRPLALVAAGGALTGALLVGAGHDLAGPLVAAAVAALVVPLLLVQRAHAAFVEQSQRSSSRLREAAETIQAQNVSLEQANRLLRRRSSAAMESLSATVDARDSSTAGHSRRVQQLALAIGRELGLSRQELDLLDRAALFHDIGKLAIPDAILLKAGPLAADEWRVMQLHAEEGARIIERLGFLSDAVPAIRHHHEHWDGSGYPDGLVGDEIPLGARIIHIADALDSMLTARIYRPPKPLVDALQEIRDADGTQFCPRCVAAVECLLPLETPTAEISALVGV